jgi:hypothetical protein
LPSPRREDPEAGAAPDEVTDAEEFARQVEGRLGDAHGMPFALIHARCTGRRVTQVGKLLVEHVRDAGDLVGSVPDGFAVLLQGARPRHAEGYLARVRQSLSGLPGGTPDVDVTVFSSATDAPAILEVVRAVAA